MNYLRMRKMFKVSYFYFNVLYCLYITKKKVVQDNLQCVYKEKLHNLYNRNKYFKKEIYIKIYILYLKIYIYLTEF